MSARLSEQEYAEILARRSAAKARTQVVESAPAKKSKYRNTPVELCGVRFDSKKEAARFLELCRMEKMGEVYDLQRQVKFSLDVNDQHVCNYFADFTYQTNGEFVVEDSKSPASKTPTYKLKSKLMKAIHGITILET